MDWAIMLKFSQLNFCLNATIIQISNYMDAHSRRWANDCYTLVICAQSSHQLCESPVMFEHRRHIRRIQKNAYRTTQVSSRQWRAGVWPTSNWLVCSKSCKLNKTLAIVFHQICILVSVTTKEQIYFSITRKQTACSFVELKRLG